MTPEDSAETVFLGASSPPSPPAGTRPSGPLEVGQRFGSRYHILRQLGIGGMGAVYQAWDAELGVAVALKVIRPEVMHDPAAAQDIERRFKQELLLARQVTHKNVVRIHDLGEIDGIKYITMPYIEGQDLASVLRSERLPVPKVMALATAGCRGTPGRTRSRRGPSRSEAGQRDDRRRARDHHGLRHRAVDVARRLGAATGDAATPTLAPAALKVDADAEMTRIAETVVGEVIGTIEYMAPEQARGEHVDQRADVYAFGLILYDMLAGKRRSEHAVSAVGELQKRLAQPPPSIRTILPEIPQPLDQLITKCTEPDAAKRFQTTTELVTAIERLDDNGKLRPVKRDDPAAVCDRRGGCAAGALGIHLVGHAAVPSRPTTCRWSSRTFRTRPSDAAFNGTLEPMLKRALEGAELHQRVRPRRHPAHSSASQPPEQLDETAARGLAVKQGLGVVLAGSIEPSGQRLRDHGEGHAGRHRRGHHERPGAGRQQGPGSRRRRRDS